MQSHEQTTASGPDQNTSFSGLTTGDRNNLQRKFSERPGTSGKPHFQFVNFIHSGEPNAAQAIPFAHGADVICFERPTMPKADRVRYANALNQNAEGTLLPDHREELVSWLSHPFDSESDDAFYLDLKFLEELEDSGKVFIPIDTVTDDPRAQELEAVVEERDELMKRLYSKDITLEEARSIMLLQGQAEANDGDYRDAVVSEQLLEVNKELEGKPVEVAVFIGSAHTKSFHQSKRNGLSASRHFIPEDPDPSIRIRYSYNTQVQRIMQFTLNDVPTQIIDRAIAEFYISAGMSVSGMFEEEISSDAGYIAKRLDTVSDAEIAAGLEATMAQIQSGDGSFTRRTIREAGTFLSDRFGINFTQSTEESK